MSATRSLAPLWMLACLAGCHCGSATAGGTCSTNSDCASGFCSNGFCADAPDGSPDDAGPQALDAALDAGEDASTAQCLTASSPCTPGQSPACCSGLCLPRDAGAPTCGELVLCSAPGSPCSTPTDCCSLVCQAGTCAMSVCQQIGAPCGAGSDCCSGTCDQGACASVPGATCKTLGESCALGADCCSKNCQSGQCLRASACGATGDLCYKAVDCCNGVCLLPDAGSGPGTCAVDVTVPGATACGMGGEPCEDSTGCCSHLCIDLGTGKPSCVLGSGCRERGELCSKDEDCCGSTSSGVVCQLATANPPMGRCSNKQACQPVGNCCGSQGANCEQACCDGQKDVCRLDSAGLSRCFGGGAVCPKGWNGLDPNCCIEAGDECQFRDQCCNLNPCTQVDGKYVCQAQDCVAAGSSCTPGATGPEACCNGLACQANGELGGFSCRLLSAAPDAGPGGDVDGGPDGGAGACLTNGASCSSAGGCCSGACVGGTCGACRASGQDCGGPSECCSGVCASGKCATPATCVNAGGVCSGISECCPGTTCEVPLGQANGACVAGSACSGAGQGCSESQACCTGLRCTDFIGADCAPDAIECSCRSGPN